MLTSTRSASRMPRARRSQGLRRFARVGLVAAWLMFWLNTALFPCCEVVAAVLGGHADNATPAASAEASPHHSGAMYSAPLHHSSDSPCYGAQISASPLVVEYKGLIPDRSPLEWCAYNAPLSTSFTAPIPPAIFALARASPLPSVRFYLRTQRLLI